MDNCTYHDRTIKFCLRSGEINSNFDLASFQNEWGGRTLEEVCIITCKNEHAWVKENMLTGESYDPKYCGNCGTALYSIQ